MKKTISVFMIAAFVATCLSSCNEKKKSQVIIAPKPSAPKPKKTQELSSYEQTRDIEWLGKSYQVVMKRVADHELPVVECEDHSKYYDNKITIKVLREDSTEFFNRAFLKSDFTEYLDEHTKKTGSPHTHRGLPVSLFQPLHHNPPHSTNSPFKSESYHNLIKN